MLQPSNTAQTAEDTLRDAIRASESISLSARSLLEKLSAAPRPAIEVGGFYITLDRSLVCVAKVYTKCKCAACSGRSQMANIFGLQLLVADINAEPDPAPPADATHEPSESDQRYLVVVLRGGHGVKDIAGEEPGDRYIVDGKGLAVISITTHGGGDVVTSASVEVAGLSLERQIQLRVVEEQPAQLT